MHSLTIGHPGLMTSIQDMGRKGMMYYAIPKSGVLDQTSARQALQLLNLPDTTPLIECTSKAPQIEFHQKTQIALTGADFNWTVNGKSIQPNALYTIQAQDVLSGSFARKGLRGYIAIRGILYAQQVYGSTSTYVNAEIGGFKGRFLQKGDVLQWQPFGQIHQRSVKLPSLEMIQEIPIHPGPEYHLLSESARIQLTQQWYTIHADSNRMGIRLSGTPLSQWDGKLDHSRPVLPGFIQLPPNGIPIILLQDGQVSGGYPRVGYLRKEMLGALSQVALGGSVRFEWVR